MHHRCRQLTRRYCNNRIEPDHRAVKRRLRAMQGPRTMPTAWAVIQGVEAAQMIRNGQVLGITRQNLWWASLGFRCSPECRIDSRLISLGPGASPLRRCNTSRG
jgi:hypothetical protein